eukprot:CAMPEP_0170468904 /NCGR_PEP_ID=MMETSP0123-20130129/11914_1 /TAXON_ID=182087 /ORGANISM="Favella ehrenbergii, Strain Fehren 1" /LENGTH=55 /DNA_ID=CAMNT_0010735599 /DNA_START=530 /DNA_END=697 /DNA_ORIENTATION=+
MAFLQMGDTDQAHDTDFENTISRVFSNENVDSERGNSFFHLDIDPDQVLALKQHE